MQIFQMQTEKLREALDDHDFVFVDGAVPTAPSEGATAVTNETYGYIPDRINDASQCRELLAGLVDYCAHSPQSFDGVMGFSEGGIVAAMLLLEDARRPFAGFKCGIFFSAALPLDPDVVRTDVVRCINPDVDGVVLRVPTALIAEEDLVRLRDRSPLAPLWCQEDAQEALVRVCDEGLREVVRHAQGHQVPGFKTTDGLLETLQAIERTIERAMDLFDQ
ncbi:Serine hydrolase FSH1 [Aspergillus sp. HF37]|nr:Serine hydrolase FSH1 [Aspergillus sp. HF37]